MEKLVEALFTNKDQFTKLFCATKGGTQFEMSLCFNEAGTLDTDPKPQEHEHIFMRLFEQMEESVFKNQALIFYMQDLTDLFFWGDQK